MHVGLLLDHHDPRGGGLERALNALVHALHGSGHTVSVFAATSTCAPPLPARLHLVSARALTRTSRAHLLSARLSAAAHAARCDVTLAARHVAAPDVLWLHGGAHRASLHAKREAATNRPRPSPAPLHGRHRAYDALERAAVLHNARAILVPSALTRAELLALYGPLDPTLSSRLAVVPNGVDLARFSPSARPEARASLRARLGLAPSDRRPLVALAARNPALKGAVPLTRALANSRVPAALLLAGPARPRPWRRLARLLAPTQTLHVLPEVEPVELAAGVDVAAQPTWRDPCSLATLEALAAGTPVVTTRRNGAVSASTPGVWLVADPSDLAGLAAALLAALAAGPTSPPGPLARRDPVRSERESLARVIAALESVAATRRDGAPRQSQNVTSTASE